MDRNRELEHRFSYHRPHGDQPGRYQAIRDTILTAAQRCVVLSPECPEQARALEALDQAMFLFNAAIARREAAPSEFVK